MTLYIKEVMSALLLSYLKSFSSEIHNPKLEPMKPKIYPSLSTDLVITPSLFYNWADDWLHAWPFLDDNLI